MAFSKAHKFQPSDYHFSLLCKALSHPARIAMLRKIIRNTEVKQPVDILALDIPLSRPAISQHLKILRDMHILKCEGFGPSITYWLNPDLPNTYWGIIHLMFQTDVKYDENYARELGVISSRRSIGTAPF